MIVHPLATDLSVPLQISTTDASTLQDLRFRSIVCLQPDGEVPNQPSFREMAHAARRMSDQSPQAAESRQRWHFTAERHRDPVPGPRLLK
ncbi:sulfur transferase domain-containing protein [Caballeronia sp. ATUFL_M1_KS5A]|uniref:beta-lactamase hydrolase domain-containing protein n=1 Tax=Caballeronia sp. ATUFL_M1_KS5A TaxID=2921778 RepID=UPI002028D500|nr:sulfur transferase domain-containing protein [Caballeronia sp. ATUFL_M1_KS5A]